MNDLQHKVYEYIKDNNLPTIKEVVNKFNDGKNPIHHVIVTLVKKGYIEYEFIDAKEYLKVKK